MVKYSERVTAGGLGTDDGTRTDVGGVVTYEWDEDTAAYVLVQTTVSRSGDRDKNDRVGVGGKMALTEKVDLVWRSFSRHQRVLARRPGLTIIRRPMIITTSATGLIRPGKIWSIMTNRELDGDDLGVFVAGARYRFNEQFSAFGEDTYDIFGERRSLTQTYGVTYTPTANMEMLVAHWKLETITDDTINSGTGLKNSDFDRIAASLSTAYHGENGIEGRMKGEVRLRKFRR